MKEIESTIWMVMLQSLKLIEAETVANSELSAESKEFWRVGLRSQHPNNRPLLAGTFEDS
jgi:hypothetical protein